MSKKKLQVEAIANELEGASLYFKPPASTPVTQPKIEPLVSVPTPKPVTQESSSNEIDLSDRLSSTSRDDSMHASKDAINLSGHSDDLIETIRKTVKKMGKEVSFIRHTPEEKRELSSIVYTFNELYRGQGRKTSENEIGRIALNFLIADYKENGELSVLARVLEALNA